MSCTVALVDDHLLVAETLSAELTRRGLVTQTCPPADTGPLQQALLSLSARLVILDLDLGRYGSALPLIAPLSAAGTRVLVVTGSTDRLEIASALERGAVGYRSKSEGIDALVDAAEAALGTSVPLDQNGRADMLDELRRARSAHARRAGRYARLTVREQRTLRALGDGLCVAEIAREWVVAESTVRSHVRGVLEKLGVTSQLAAVASARADGWLDDPDALLAPGFGPRASA